LRKQWNSLIFTAEPSMLHQLTLVRLQRPAAFLAFGAAALSSTAGTAAEPSLQDLSAALQSLPPIVIYQAKEVVTLDPAKPNARAVAVVGDRILAVGELDDLTKAAGTQPYTVNTQFADQVVVPGFIAQHDHPLLAALTMTSEIIAIEDWVLLAFLVAGVAWWYGVGYAAERLVSKRRRG